MVKLIEDDDGVLCDKHRILFPSLKELFILYQPKLQIFCNWRCELDLPSLELVTIKWCPLLEFLTMKSVRFHSLKEIKISGCDNNRSLFLSSVAKTLVNLKELSIRNCTEMVKVIEDDEDILCEKPLLLFPSLKKLRLVDLPKLESFCNWKCDLQLSSLEEVVIESCPLLAFFTMGNVTTENLEHIFIDWEAKSLEDLNTVIKRHFNAERQEDIGRGGHTFIEESTSVETKGMEAHNEKI